MDEKNIFVFPGQGAQYVGMGAGIYQNFSVARQVFENVSDIAGKDIAKISFDGPQDVLNKPENTSLATFAHSVAIVRSIERELGQSIRYFVNMVAGHSMGQYSALHCAGVLSMFDAVNLLAARSAYMSMLGNVGGGMVVIVGLSRSEIELCLGSVSGAGFVQISNHNAYDQFVVSGQNSALDAVVVAAQKMGARIAKRLNVAVPAHCGLMKRARVSLEKDMSGIRFHHPKINWFSNQTADLVSDSFSIRMALLDQMTNGVRWYDIMKKFPNYNIKYAYELGPGKTLTGLINRAGIGCVACACDKVEQLKKIIDNFMCCKR